MPYLDQFHHFFMGDPTRPKLVFLHGLLGFSANWRSVAREFSDTHHILVFDQRGHGRSFQPEFGYAPEDYADDLLKILDELNWARIALVGHSMGGRNALNFAARFPDRVEKLVIEDIGPFANPDAADGYRKMFAAVPTPFASRAEALRFMREDFPRVWPSGGANLGLFLYSNFEEHSGAPNDRSATLGIEASAATGGGTVGWRTSTSAVIQSVLAGQALDRWKEWNSLTIPTLLIRGGNSNDLLPATYDEMLARNPLAIGCVIPNAGHWVHSEKFAEFVEALRGFLN